MNSGGSSRITCMFCSNPLDLSIVLPLITDNNNTQFANNFDEFFNSSSLSASDGIGGRNNLTTITSSSSSLSHNKTKSKVNRTVKGSSSDIMPTTTKQKSSLIKTTPNLITCPDPNASSYIRHDHTSLSSSSSSKTSELLKKVVGGDVSTNKRKRSIVDSISEYVKDSEISARSNTSSTHVVHSGNKSSTRKADITPPPPFYFHPLLAPTETERFMVYMVHKLYTIETGKHIEPCPGECGFLLEIDHDNNTNTHNTLSSTTLTSSSSFSSSATKLANIISSNRHTSDGSTNDPVHRRSKRIKTATPEVTNSDANLLACPKCSTVVCPKCYHGTIEGTIHKCFDAQETIKTDESWTNIVSTSQNAKPCPWCSQLVEKSHGCNHLTCNCGAQFCYRCRSLWYKNNTRERNCDCPSFDPPRNQSLPSRNNNIREVAAEDDDNVPFPSFLFTMLAMDMFQNPGFIFMRSNRR